MSYWPYELRPSFDRYIDKALLLHGEVLRLHKPADTTLKAFKQYFEPKPNRSRLRGNSSRILDDESDLLALRVPADQDRLTRIVQVYCPWLFTVCKSWHSIRVVWPTLLSFCLDRKAYWTHCPHLRAQNRPFRSFYQHFASCHAAHWRHSGSQLRSLPGLAYGAHWNIHGLICG